MRILVYGAGVQGCELAHRLLQNKKNVVTMLARGVPVGGELDWLDDGTINQAMRARRPA